MSLELITFHLGARATSTK